MIKSNRFDGEEIDYLSIGVMYGSIRIQNDYVKVPTPQDHANKAVFVACPHNLRMRTTKQSWTLCLQGVLDFN